jgi:hypothetical protein
MKLSVCGFAIGNLRRKGELVIKSSVIAVAVISCLLAFAVAVPAQQPAEPKMEMHNMMGCLTKTDTNSYLIMNADPK